MEQRSEEWFAARLGKATGSKVHDIVAKTKSGYSAGRKNYEAQLIAERLTGEIAESFSNAAMEWGTLTEQKAVTAYEFIVGVDTHAIGFVDHPEINMSGASPDRLVGEDGLVEIKCPMTATHLETLLGSKVKANYVTQMQWQMACTGRAWCDFVSFDPRLPANLQMHVQRVHRDDAHIAELEGEVRTFLKAVDEKVQRLRAIGGMEIAA